MTLRHAIVGCGRIAPNHVDGCVYNGVEIAACFDIDREKAKKFAAKNKIISIADSFKSLLADRTINSVSICTDHKSHSNLAIKALRAGKNVIVEKPMALDISQAKKMIVAAKNNRKILAVISQLRYLKMVREIKHALESNIFGTITLVNATLNCYKDKNYYTESNWKGTLEKEGGSTLINQAIHTLDVLLWLKGLPVKVKSFGSNLKFKNIIETEDTLASVMKFPDESLAILSSTNTSIEPWDSKIEIIGTKGSLIFSIGFPPKILKLIHGDKKTAGKLRQRFESKTEDVGIPISADYYGTTHRNQMADFFNAITGKTKRLFMPPEEALKTLTVVLDLYKYR